MIVLAPNFGNVPPWYLSGCLKGNEMRRTSGLSVRSPGSSLRPALGVSLLCLAVFTGYALAQAEPPDPQPKAEPKGLTQTEPKGLTQAEPKSKAEPAPKGKTKAEGKPNRESKPNFEAKPAAKQLRPGQAKQKPLAVSKKARSGKARRPVKFEMDPNAKWASDQQTVTLPPVWQGNKKLTFTFHIRNEGTADLKIRAKGG